MKNYIKSFYNHSDLMFWLLGNMYWCIISLDFNNAKDTYYWLRIHLTYKGQKVEGEKRKISIKQRLLNIRNSFLGISITFLIFYNLIKLILWMIIV